MRTGRNDSKTYDITADPSLGRVRRSVVGWLGLFLLAFNILAGGSLQAQAGTGFGQNLNDDRIVICTSGGMAVVDRNGTPVAPEHAGQNGFCAYCLPLLTGAALVPAAQSVPAPYGQPTTIAVAATTESAPSPHPLRLAFPRGPPQA